MIFKGKKFLIVGISLSGAASAQLLLSRGAEVFLFDDNKRSEIEQFAASGAIDVSSSDICSVLQDVYCIVVSPGVPSTHKIIEMAKSKDIPIISEIELAYDVYKGVTLAVTGTNGKSTVTSLLHHILKSSGEKSNLCGNIGVPFTYFSDDLYDSCCCVEISSFQLEYCQDFKPHISGVLNVSPDHLNRHFTMENYIAAKKQIFAKQTKTEYTILNFDCPYCRTFFEDAKSNVYWFSLTHKVNGAYLYNGNLMFNDQLIMSADKILMPGMHNVSNCLAAICYAKLFGVSNTDIASAISTFKGITHRLQYLGNINGKNFYNDSKATNINSAMVAIEAAPYNTVLILGGYDKHSDFSQLIEKIKLSDKITACVIYGAVAHKIVEEAENQGYYKYEHIANFENAVNAAYEMCEDGGAVLLSPACASYDQFKNFEQRGEAFCAISEKLKK